MSEHESPFRYDEAEDKPDMTEMVLTAITMRQGVVLAYQWLPKSVAAEVIQKNILQMTGVKEEEVEDAIRD